MTHPPAENGVNIWTRPQPPAQNRVSMWTCHNHQRKTGLICGQGHTQLRNTELICGQYMPHPPVHDRGNRRHNVPTWTQQGYSNMWVDTTHPTSHPLHKTGRHATPTCTGRGSWSHATPTCKNQGQQCGYATPACRIQGWYVDMPHHLLWIRIRTVWTGLVGFGSEMFPDPELDPPIPNNNLYSLWVILKLAKVGIDYIILLSKKLSQPFCFLGRIRIRIDLKGCIHTQKKSFQIPNTDYKV